MNGRLRDLLPGVEGATIEGADQGSKVGMTTHAAEAPTRFVETGGDPAHEHAPVPPAPNVADEAADEAVQVLDRVRAAQRAVERARHAESLQRERLVEPFAQRRGSAGMGPVERLNELEYVKGEIFANVWQTERIARISPKDGRVIGWIDLSGLLSPAERAGTDVLNGIAYDAAGDRLFVTGKLWPKLFEIKLVKK